MAREGDMSHDGITKRPYLENVLIALCVAGSLGLLSVAWWLGDGTFEAQTRQWQIVFLGLALALAGQWIVSASPASKIHQISATCFVLAAAGVGIQAYYDINWAASTPFIIGYIFLFLAVEIGVYLGLGREATDRAIQYMRFAVVAWNVGWGVSNIGVSFLQLPDIVNLYIAFSALWTVATGVIAWSEFATMNARSGESTMPPRRYASIPTLSGK
jgi:hypothetical protein